ncbi:hypothetical protein SAMN05444413_101393 [Roseivivax marinus]|nr:hypothetical protein SAMN05444413_101393 [Roseivivax marinus]
MTPRLRQTVRATGGPVRAAQSGRVMAAAGPWPGAVDRRALPLAKGPAR